MSLKRAALSQVNRIFNLLNAEVANKAEIDFLRQRCGGPAAHGMTGIPIVREAAHYLQRNNPRLIELRARYRAARVPMVEHSKWTDDLVRGDIELQNFRGDNAYVYQLRDYNTASDYLLTAYYLRDVDRLRLFDRLEEDGLFGVHSFRWNGRLITRDLLDSIAEINFLEETLELSARPQFRVLDIGAGYGRLAYRLTSAFPTNVEMFCTDAVAESTFLSEFHLRFRRVDDRARVIPLDEIQAFLEKQSIDLVTNIHSFSECTLTSVCGWLDLVRKHAVRYLLIIPNSEDNGGTELITLEKDKSRVNYLHEIRSRGYNLIATRPKFVDTSVQAHGVSPTHYYLFELAR